jgi:hypothetical protein
MTTSAEAAEVHPAASVTVKLYVAAVSPERVVDVPVPAIAPGLIVQLPAGKLLRITLPVDRAQVGCVIVPTAGAEGAAGTASITISAEATEVQPEALVTVKLYVPVMSPEIVVVAPVPVIFPGLIVHVPVGNPVSITVPVATAQVGWVIVPTAGAAGVTGWVLITISGEAGEVQPAAFVTV